MGLGGPGRDRTDDLFHAMEARSQLRHRPTKRKAVSILADWEEIVNVIKGAGAEHRLYHHVICVLRL